LALMIVLIYKKQYINIRKYIYISKKSKKKE
jgi:hypothetical protein